MKYLLFFFSFYLFVKGVFLTYASATGFIYGAPEPIYVVVAAIIATVMAAFLCFIVRPWKRK